MLLPIDYFTVGVMRVFGAEGWPANQTFEHDGANRPPVTPEGIPSARENLRSNVIRSTDRGVSEDTARFAPGIDLGTVANGQIDLIQGDGLSVFTLFLVSTALQELLVVRIVMLFVETCRKAEVGELDVASPVKENVVRFDITNVR